MASRHTQLGRRKSQLSQYIFRREELSGRSQSWLSQYIFRREELYRALLARVLLLAGLLLAVSGLVGLGDVSQDAWLAVGLGGFMAVLGGLGMALHQLPQLASRRDVFVAAGLAWLAVIGCSTLYYRLTSSFATIDDALFESVAGLSTTSFSIYDDPAQLSSAVLFWRAGTQWLGGAGALALSLLLIPLFYGKATIGREGSSKDEVRFAQFWRRSSEFSSYFSLYVLLTAAIAVAYALAGMGAFDALTYAFTTASTGGFANHADSLAHFGAAVEWVAIGAMFMAGISGALLFKALRGSVGSLWRSLEFKVYLGVSVVAAGASYVWSDISGHEAHARESLLAVVSAISTTGFRVVDWTLWNPGLQLLLLVLMATGAMAGSTSGGFQILRATEAGHYLWREILNYASPTPRTSPVRHDFLGEGPLSRMQAFQMVYLAAVGLGSFALACFGHDVVTALTGSVSALATMGPALGELGPLASVEVLSRPERALLAALMLFGRLFFYPVLIIAGTLLVKVRWLRKR